LVTFISPVYDSRKRNNQAQNAHKHSLTFRVWRCCHSSETRALIPDSAQLEFTPTIPQVTAGFVQ